MVIDDSISDSGAASPEDETSRTATDELQPPEQAIVIAVATLVAFAYGALTQVFWLHLYKVNWTPILILCVAAGFFLFVIVGHNAARTAALSLFPWLQRLWRKDSGREWSFAVIALFMLSTLCAVLLGCFTLYTGGTFRSPYSQALLALALLSPQLAKSKETIVAMFFVVAIMYVVFGLIGIAARTTVVIPDALVAWTTIITAAIALFYPVFGRATEVPSSWLIAQRAARQRKPPDASA